MPSEGQPITYEALPTIEQERPSPALILRIAHGVNNQTDNTVPREVHRSSFDALNRQNMIQRKRDEAEFKQQAEHEGKATDPQILRHNHMVKWTTGSIMEINRIIDAGQAGSSDTTQRTADIAAALNKLGISLDPKNAVGQFYQDNEQQPGPFYQQFCGRDMPERLADTLSTEEMSLLKPFLTNWMLGSDEAFNALVTLRLAKDQVRNRVGIVEPKAAEPLSPRDAKILAYFQEGLTLTDDDEKVKPDSNFPTPNAGDIENETTNVKDKYRESEVNPDHQERNDDTSVIDASRGFGAILDGAGGYEGGDKASREAEEAISEVMKSIPKSATPEITRDYITKALQLANQRAAKTGGGTTAAVFQIIAGENGQKKLIVGNMGDSRVWIRRKDGTVIQITKDQGNLRNDYLVQLQQATNPSEQKKLTESYLYIDSLLSNATTSTDLTQLSESQRDRYWRHRNQTILLGKVDTINDYVEFFEENLSDGDIVFATTDGVHDNLTTEEIEAIAEKADPTVLHETLVRKASERSRTSHFRHKLDDITAIILPIPDEELGNVQEQPETETEKVPELIGTNS